MSPSPLRRLWPWLVIALIAASALSPPAPAAPPAGAWLDSTGPVARFGTSQDLHCLAWREGEREGVFFGDTGCGTLVSTDEGLFVPDDVPGANPLDDVSSAFTPIAQTHAGDGSAAAPFSITTSVMAGTAIRLDQTDTHRAVSSEVLTTLTVSNAGGVARTVTVFRAADCYSGGDDEGWGELGPTSASCVSTGVPRVVRLWDTDNREGVRTFEGDSDDLWRRIAQYAPGGSPRPLGGCACTTRTDNAVALAWTIRLEPGESIALRSSTDVGAPIPPGPLGVHENGLETTSRPYVALGDSYSSGEGAGDQGEASGYDYMAGTDWPGNRCHRSWNAYPVLVARSLGYDPDHDLSFRACSGATIADLTSANDDEHGVEAAQTAWVGRQTELVTMTIGGNDAGFGRVVASCVAPTTCNRGMKAFADQAYDRLAATTGSTGLAAAYGAVSDRLGPRARFLVLGYPDFVPFFPRCNVDVYLTEKEKIWLSDQIFQVNGLAAKRARQAHAGFVDTSRDYRRWNSPHRICQGDEYVNGIRLSRSDDAPVASESFHPNKLGHSAMTRLVLESRRPTRRVGGRHAMSLGDAADTGAGVIEPGGTRDVPLPVAPDSDVMVSVRSGDTPTSLTLLGPSGPVPLKPDDPTNLGGRPGAFVLQTRFGSSVWLNRVPPARYTLRVAIDAAAAPTLVDVTVSALEHVNSPPFALAQARVVGGLVVRFDGSMGGDRDDRSAQEMAWTFGDGSASASAIASHRYDRRGRFVARVSVRDRDGATATDALVVDLTPHRPYSVRLVRRGGSVVATVACAARAVERCRGSVSAGGRRVQVSVARGARASLRFARGPRALSMSARITDGAARPEEMHRWHGRA